MKKVSTGLGVCLALFLAVNFIVGIVSPDQWAFDAAQTELDRRGADNDQLFLDATSNVSSGFLGSTAVVTFEAKDTNKTIRVTLRKRINLFGWQVIDYDEQG